MKASLVQEWMVAWVSGLCGALALLVAGLGVYGITAFGVTQRRGEIAIRMALGAGRSDVIRLAPRRSIALTMAGMLFWNRGRGRRDTLHQRAAA